MRSWKAIRVILRGSKSAGRVHKSSDPPASPLQAFPARQQAIPEIRRAREIKPRSMRGIK